MVHVASITNLLLNNTIEKRTQFTIQNYMFRRTKLTDKLDSEGLKSHNKFTHLTRDPARIKEDD